MVNSWWRKLPRAQLSACKRRQQTTHYIRHGAHAPVKNDAIARRNFSLPHLSDTSPPNIQILRYAHATVPLAIVISRFNISSRKLHL